MTVEIIESDVKAAARAIGAAAEGVAALDLTGPMAQMASALPGSPVVAAANGLKAEWTLDQDTWVKDARDHKRATLDAASAIVEADVITAQQARFRAETVGRI